MPRLSDYQTDTQDLLRDAANLFYTVTQINNYINRARYQIALRTGCIRVTIMGQSSFGGSASPGTMIPGGITPGMPVVNLFQTIVGQEKYPYAYANSFLKSQNTGIKSVVCVHDVAVSWGGIRPNMEFMSWGDMQAYARSYNVGVFSYPFKWSINGIGENSQVWLFPIPAVGPTLSAGAGAQGEMEWDTSCVPTPLYTNDDYEALPDPFTNGVKFYAARLALLGAQRYGPAQLMQEMFQEHLEIDNVGQDWGKVQSYYYQDY